MTQRKIAINIMQVSRFSILLFAVTAILFTVPFFLLNHNWLGHLSVTSGILFVIILFIGVPLHEGLHGLTWALVNKGGFKHVSFGVLWQYLAPYCHYSEPMTRGRYVAGAIMPCLVLGLVPAVAALFHGYLLMLVFGIIYISSAAADLWMTWLILKEPKHALFLDHPSEPAFYVIER